MLQMHVHGYHHIDFFTLCPQWTAQSESFGALLLWDVTVLSVSTGLAVWALACLRGFL